MQSTTFIRLGLATVAASAVVFAVGDALMADSDAFLEAASDPERFVAAVTGDRFSLWAARGLVGEVLEVIGALALFLALWQAGQARLAIWSTILLLIGDLAGFALFGHALHVMPYAGELLATGTAPEQVTEMASVPTWMLIGVSITYLGLALSALAVQRCGVLPRWSGWLVFAGFLFVSGTPAAVQAVASLAWGAGYAWMAYGLRPDAVSATADSQLAVH